MDSMVYNIVYCQFDLALQSEFAGDGNGMSIFLGKYYLWAGIAGVEFQLLFAGAILRRYGLATAMAILPVAYAPGSGLVLVTGGVLLALTITRANRSVFLYTVIETSLGLLYLLFDRDLRAKGKAITGGIFKPLAASLIGFLFVIVGRWIGISV